MDQRLTKYNPVLGKYVNSTFKRYIGQPYVIRHVNNDINNKLKNLVYPWEYTFNFMPENSMLNVVIVDNVNNLYYYKRFRIFIELLRAYEKLKVKYEISLDKLDKLPTVANIFKNPFCCDEFIFKNISGCDKFILKKIINIITKIKEIDDIHRHDLISAFLNYRKLEYKSKEITQKINKFYSHLHQTYKFFKKHKKCNNNEIYNTINIEYDDNLRSLMVKYSDNINKETLIDDLIENYNVKNRNKKYLKKFKNVNKKFFDENKEINDCIDYYKELYDFDFGTFRNECCDLNKAKYLNLKRFNRYGNDKDRKRNRSTRKKDFRKYDCKDYVIPYK